MYACVFEHVYIQRLSLEISLLRCVTERDRDKERGGGGKGRGETYMYEGGGGGERGGER